MRRQHPVRIGDVVRDGWDEVVVDEEAEAVSCVASPVFGPPALALRVEAVGDRRRGVPDDVRPPLGRVERRVAPRGVPGEGRLDTIVEVWCRGRVDLAEVRFGRDADGDVGRGASALDGEVTAERTALHPLEPGRVEDAAHRRRQQSVYRGCLEAVHAIATTAVS
jgi:hypothetical protein